MQSLRHDETRAGASTGRSEIASQVLVFGVVIPGRSGTGPCGYWEHRELGGVLGSLLLPRLLYYLRYARCGSRAASQVFQSDLQEDLYSE
jgi:hypothetical protein